MRKWSSHHVTIAPLLLLKEKWLDEESEKICVLKYVATFKGRLFRVGQMAKRNLQDSKRKMKVWYDRKTKSRRFEPGDRVLVLFSVVGNPLQAKYSGPYKVVKKISDTNYLVRIPCRRKETQVCHINMLKAYHEKPKPELVILNNKLGLENPTHSKSCVGIDAEKALQDEEFAEAQRAREEAQKAREDARELRLAELKEARELHELELKAEEEKALLEAEKGAAAHEHELKMASLGKHPPSDRASTFDPARNIR